MVTNARREVNGKIVNGLSEDITAKEFYDGYKEDHLLVSIYGYDFKIFVDIQDNKPCFYPDSTWNDTIKIDSSKNFRKLSTCIKDIERQLKEIFKKLKMNIEKPIESKKKILKNNPYYFEYFFKPEKELHKLASEYTPNIEIMKNVESDIVKKVLKQNKRIFYLIKEEEYEKFNQEELFEIYCLINEDLDDFSKEIYKNMEKEDLLFNIEKYRRDFLENSI